MADSKTFMGGRVSDDDPMQTELFVDGVVVSGANPVPVIGELAEADLHVGGVPASVANAVPVEITRSDAVLSQLNRLPISDALSDALVAGKVWVASTGNVAIGATQSFKATLQNPGGSGKTMIVAKVLVSSDIAGTAIGNVLRTGAGSGGSADAALTNAPANVLAPKNAILGLEKAGAATVAVVNAAAGVAMGGGVDMNWDFAVGQRMQEINFGFIVPAGIVIGFNLPVGALGSGTGAMGLVYVEENA